MNKNKKITYQEALTKLMEHQRHMFHELTVLKDDKQAPENLLHGMAAAQRFRDIVEGREGLEEPVDLRDAEEFLHSIYENEDILSSHEMHLANEYGSILGELKKLFGNPLE